MKELTEKNIDSLLDEYVALFHGGANSWFSVEAKELYYKFKAEAILTPYNLDDYSLLALAITLADNSERTDLSSDLFSNIKKDLENASFTRDFLQLFNLAEKNKKMLLNNYADIYIEASAITDEAEGVKDNE